MFILKNGHQPGVYVPLRALFLVQLNVHDFEMCTNVNNRSIDQTEACEIATQSYLCP